MLLLIQLRRQSAGVCKAMEACHIEIEAQVCFNVTNTFTGGVVMGALLTWRGLLGFIARLFLLSFLKEFVLACSRIDLQ